MDLGVWGLKTDSFDGAAMGDAYQKPEPTEHDLVAAEGEKVYTGNCHCGAVKIAIKTKPLPEQLVQRCNCSICIRVCFQPVCESHSKAHHS